ncbi:RibD family protein [Dethiothermospora halolimnae]|uniref:RibD family protein n=1 Tax=Dethiothermospora halolimnae TaxID=3114390 RepID=UPI003CCBCCBB
MKLPHIEFPKEKIKLNRIYTNNKILDKWASNIKIPKKISEVYGSIYFPNSLGHRPYVYSSIVLTMDGKLGFNNGLKSTLISKGNKGDPYGGLADLWMVNLLRTYSDGVVLGTRTLNVEENISGHVYDLDLVKARGDILNKKPIPWNIIISRRGRMIPFDHVLFERKEIPICIMTTGEGFKYIKENINRSYIKVLAGEGNIQSTIDKRKNEVIIIVSGDNYKIDIKKGMKALKDMGIDNLAVESPTIFYYLMEEKLLDEAFVNYSGLYAGGNLALGNNIPFTSENHPEVDILSIHIHRSNFIYTRQKFRY